MAILDIQSNCSCRQLIPVLTCLQILDNLSYDRAETLETMHLITFHIVCTLQENQLFYTIWVHSMISNLQLKQLISLVKPSCGLLLGGRVSHLTSVHVSRCSWILDRSTIIVDGALLLFVTVSTLEMVVQDQNQCSMPDCFLWLNDHTSLRRTSYCSPVSQEDSFLSANTSTELTEWADSGLVEGWEEITVNGKWLNPVVCQWGGRLPCECLVWVVCHARWDEMSLLSSFIFCCCTATWYLHYCHWL